MKNKLNILLLISIHAILLSHLLAGQEMALNNPDSFKNVIPQEIYLFLVGNNNYSDTSSFENLHYCWNDVLLMAKLFNRCCKIPKENIYTYFDIGQKEFYREWKNFISIIDRDALVVLYFSSHGGENGSIILSDNTALHPAQIRELVNSFVQDTILIIDACYSGEGENMQGLAPFKKNCIRLYSSLGYSSTRELDYKDSLFFDHMQVFYRETLGLEGLKGNGYFTALIADFFAHYQFTAKKNVSFYSFFSYITSRGKELFEDIAKRKTKGISKWELALLIDNTLPKIKPLDLEVDFIDQDHLNLILIKRIQSYRPEKNFISFSLKPSLVILFGSYEERYNPGFITMGEFRYNVNAKRKGIGGIGLSGGCSYLYFPERSDDDEPKTWPDFNKILIPVVITLSYSTNFITPFYVSGEIHCGFQITHLLPHDEEDEENIIREYIYPFRFGIGLNLGFEFAKRWGIGINVDGSYVTGKKVMIIPGIVIKSVLKEF